MIKTFSNEIFPELDSCSDRQKLCVRGLKKLGTATANELAMYFYTQGMTKFFNRNFVHPRLNELEALGIVEIVGKKVDPITGKICGIYKVKKISQEGKPCQITLGI